ncbi:general odorant-binding protein lush [Condylostylus longicornis]|uniref:general odorant-binding protein lush n=1 Tax=Condylostylus longicornis TaxID=2530218 RepID=UPI00244E2B95|nr:general odorant-binding protein lush [Condylostylus longicornis]
MKLTDLMTFQKCLILMTVTGQIFSISMKEFEMSINSIRDACSPQFKITKEQLTDLRNGKFNDESKDIKCYTKCVAQMAGTLNKKGEISMQKSMAQIDMLLPEEIREISRETLKRCIHVQDNYKNPCDKTFYAAKCAADSNPNFSFP